jgi:hypothetical protein
MNRFFVGGILLVFVLIVFLYMRSQSKAIYMPLSRRPPSLPVPLGGGRKRSISYVAPTSVTPISPSTDHIERV